MDVQIIRNKKAVYFADPILNSFSESIQDECDQFVIQPLMNAGICFEDIRCTDTPPFGKMSYDILFFDWGGMSVGNSLLEHFCRYIVKEADDYPSKCYVVVSMFSEYAMRDALDEFGEKENIFLTMDDFIKHFKTNF